MTNKIKSFKNKLIKLSKPTLGSFGEFIFEQEYKRFNVTPVHKNRTDFIVDGKNVDVKTICKPTIHLTTGNYVYRGKTFPNIEYATITFFFKMVVASYDKFLYFLSYDTVIKYYNEWILKRGKYPKKSKILPIKTNVGYQSIINDITSHFKGVNLHFLHRTSSTWGKLNSPGNLLPHHNKNGKTFYTAKDQYRIYLEFNSPDINPNNINRIIAYYEPDFKKLFKIIPASKAPLANGLWDKVDMTKLPKGVVFNSIDELKKNLIK